MTVGFEWDFEASILKCHLFILDHDEWEALYNSFDCDCDEEDEIIEADLVLGVAKSGSDSVAKTLEKDDCNQGVQLDISHTNSQLVFDMALYLASVEDLDTVCCFLHFQDTKDLLRNTQNSVVDLLVSKHASQSAFIKLTYTLWHVDQQECVVEFHVEYWDGLWMTDVQVENKVSLQHSVGKYRQEKKGVALGENFVLAASKVEAYVRQPKGLKCSYLGTLDLSISKDDLCLRAMLWPLHTGMIVDNA
uniref:Uncharacterized protein n=1 Tax=Cannabis sativa TaxID=3483 RepID=A0A803NJ79_CANSA